MEGADGWVAAIKLIGAALGVLIVGLAGLFTGRRKGPPETVAEGQVVAATFVERGLMERLTSALQDTAAAARENTHEVAELTQLLKRDFHRRELDAEVRQELRNRGILE